MVIIIQLRWWQWLLLHILFRVRGPLPPVKLLEFHEDSLLPVHPAHPSLVAVAEEGAGTNCLEQGQHGAEAKLASSFSSTLCLSRNHLHALTACPALGCTLVGGCHPEAHAKGEAAELVWEEQAVHDAKHAQSESVHVGPHLDGSESFIRLLCIN